MTTKAKKKLTATLPDGTIVTRTTAREYRYVVAMYELGRWGVIAWCSRLDLAAKEVRAQQAFAPAGPVELGEVNA